MSSKKNIWFNKRELVKFKNSREKQNLKTHHEIGCKGDRRKPRSYWAHTVPLWNCVTGKTPYSTKYVSEYFVDSLCTNFRRPIEEERNCFEIMEKELFCIFGTLLDLKVQEPCFHYIIVTHQPNLLHMILVTKEALRMLDIDQTNYSNN